MKKRIIIGLTCFAGIFFVGGVYLIGTIEKTTSILDNLIKLHQVEILREELLIHAKRTQSDFAYMRTNYGPQLDTIIENVLQLADKSTKCFACHHSKETTEIIVDLGDGIHLYQNALSRVLTTRGRSERLKEEENRAIGIGQALVKQLDKITIVTKEKLERKTRASLASTGNTKILLFVLICTGPILGMGLAIIFLKGITGPVNVLLQATRRIKGGDLGFRVEGLQDEFGELAASFNDMAASLKEQMENLQRTEQLKVVGEMAAGFVHEIKNPLAGIKAAMQVLLQEGTCTDDERRVLYHVGEEAKRMESLVKSLLDFAKPAKPQLIQADINLILQETLAFARPYMNVAKADHSIRIVKEFDTHLPNVLADPVQMQQVFLNLVMNGVEAMPEGGTLTVRTQLGSSGVEIQIEDTGKGIEEHMKEELFRPFFTTKRKGTGLGLSITRRLLEMHGGTISVGNARERGTSFTITLPLSAPGEVLPPEGSALTDAVA